MPPKRNVPNTIIENNNSNNNVRPISPSVDSPVYNNNNHNNNDIINNNNKLEDNDVSDSGSITSIPLLESLQYSIQQVQANSVDINSFNQFRDNINSKFDQLMQLFANLNLSNKVNSQVAVQPQPTYNPNSNVDNNNNLVNPTNLFTPSVDQSALNSSESKLNLPISSALNSSDNTVIYNDSNNNINNTNNQDRLNSPDSSNNINKPKINIAQNRLNSSGQFSKTVPITSTNLLNSREHNSPSRISSTNSNSNSKPVFKIEKQNVIRSVKQLNVSNYNNYNNSENTSENNYRTISHSNSEADINSNIKNKSNLKSTIAPAAIDSKVELPRPPKLVGNGSPNPEQFLQWANSIKDSIESVPKLRPVLLEPTESWISFQNLNPKYDASSLESIYLDAHRIVWNFIMSGIDESIRLNLTDDLKYYSKSNNLTNILNFSSINIDPNFYKNCYQLMKTLDKLYNKNTHYRAVELNKKLNSLRIYNNEDPSKFFQEWKSIQLQLKSNVEGYYMSEEQQVAVIISKLPKELDLTIKPILIANKVSTVQEIQNTLCDYWNQSSNKSKDYYKSNNKQNKSHSDTATAAAVSSTLNSNKRTFNNNKSNKPFNRDQPGSTPKSNKQNSNNSRNTNNYNTNSTSASQNDEDEVLNLVTIFDDSNNNFDPEPVDNSHSTTANFNAENLTANPLTASVNKFKYDIIIDSGASEHVTGYHTKLSNIKEAHRLNITTANNSSRPSSNQIGSIPCTPKLNLVGVRYVKDCPFTLASAAKLCAQGHQLVLTKNGGYLLRPNSLTGLLKKKDAVFEIKIKDNIYVIDNALFSEEDKQFELNNNRNGLFLRKDRDKSNSIQITNSNSNNTNLTSTDARKELNKAREARRVSFNLNNSQPSTAPANIKPQSTMTTRSQSTPESKVAATATTVFNTENTYNYLDQTDSTDSDDYAIENLVDESVVICTTASDLVDNTNNIDNSSNELPTSNKNLNLAQLWHYRLGHIGINHLSPTNNFYNLKLSKSQIEEFDKCSCQVCLENKSKRTGIGKLTANRLRKAEAIMDCWHIDLIGPFSSIENNNRRIKLSSFDGKIYGLVIVDEYSRYVIYKSIQRKSNATEELTKLIKQYQVSTGLTLKRIHSDGGKEFLNKELQSFLSSQGTEITTTTPNTPQLNGIVERMNQTLTISSRCMLNHACAPLELWSLSYTYAAQIHNMLCQPTISLEIPSKRITSNQQLMSIDHFRILFCDAYALIEEGNRGKLQSTAKASIFVGYSPQYNAYKLLDPITLEMFISRNVKFNESSFTQLQLAKSAIMQKAQSLLVPDDEEDFEVESITEHKTVNGIIKYKIFWKGYREPTWEPETNLTNCKDLLNKYKSNIKQTNTNNTRNTRSKSAIVNITIPQPQTNLGYIIPQSYKDAMSHPDSYLWKIAINAELNSLTQQCVFIPSNLPKDRKAIGCRWVFTVKRDSNNIIIKHKARLVVQGFRQQEGIDYFDTFSPTVRIKSIKYLLAIAAQEDLNIKQLDFDTAFLNASLKEDIYIKIPEGYMGELHNNNVLKLNKALYGLKQAPREWWLELDQFLNSLGYKASELDECLYQKIINNQRIYLTLYVDDTLAIYPNSLENIWLEDKTKISAKYSIKDLGDCEWILHMKVTRDRNNKIITLDQSAYLDKIIQQYNLSEAKPATDPFAYNDLTVPPDKMEVKPLNKLEHELYRSIVGSLLYAANITRVDLAYIVGVLARYCASPYTYHLAAAKRIIRYLIGTKDYQLIFKCNNNNNDSLESDYNITIYTDSSWGDNKDDRKGTGGHITTINNNIVCWQSKKHSTTPTSSTEAEYYALSQSVREALFIRQWFRVYCGQLITIEIKCDNQGAIHMSDHTTNHNRTKHIDIQYYFIREHVHLKQINVSYIQSVNQLADILTKVMKTPNFKRLTGLLLYNPKSPIN
jgi:Reverse transcriptase (RNA-dependent DNA polymerase)/Integrase core domain/GAG-pre-integrase domain/gag-polypeptide of LTR copia-type/Chromo (CHRromatin Organisation MOdifier) domain